MTDTRTCGAPGCPNVTPFPDQRYCESHRLRWLPGRPVEQDPPLPEWRRRLVAKDMTGRLAA